MKPTIRVQFKRIVSVPSPAPRRAVPRHASYMSETCLATLRRMQHAGPCSSSPVAILRTTDGTSCWLAYPRIGIRPCKSIRRVSDRRSIANSALVLRQRVRHQWTQALLRVSAICRGQCENREEIGEKEIGTSGDQIVSPAGRAGMKVN